MTQQEKTNWLVGLRSGEYIQGIRMLNPDTNTYCCLGVYCVVNNIPIYVTDDKEKSPYNVIEQDITTPVMWKLVGMNDHEMKTFTEIADWIEVNIPVTE